MPPGLKYQNFILHLSPMNYLLELSTASFFSRWKGSTTKNVVNISLVHLGFRYANSLNSTFGKHKTKSGLLKFHPFVRFMYVRSFIPKRLQTRKQILTKLSKQSLVFPSKYHHGSRNGRNGGQHGIVYQRRCHHYVRPHHRCPLTDLFGSPWPFEAMLSQDGLYQNGLPRRYLQSHVQRKCYFRPTNLFLLCSMVHT